MRNAALLVATALPLACASVSDHPRPENLALQPRPQAAVARSVALNHVRLELELDLVGQRLGGKVTCWVVALGRGATQVRLTGSTQGVREVLDARGRSLEFASSGSDGGLLVQLADPLAAGEELPLSVNFNQQSVPGLLFGETPRGPGWTPWVVAGPAAAASAAWFPLIEGEQACASFEAEVRVGHGAQVFLGGLPRSSQAITGAIEGTHLYRFDSSQPLHVQRLGLVAGRFTAAGAGPIASRVLAVTGTPEKTLSALVEALARREWGLELSLSVEGGQALPDLPPVLVCIPDARGQRLGTLGCVTLSPSLVKRLVRGDASPGLDPLALALARGRVVGRHASTRPSEAWLLEAIAAHLALQSVGGAEDRQRALNALAPDPLLWREQTIAQLPLRNRSNVASESVAARGALLLHTIELQVTSSALRACLYALLRDRQGVDLGEADLLRSFSEVDGRDLAPLLNRLLSEYGNQELL
ncbi:MAG: hypothetical protein ACI8QC_001190 [Planctomycetota bacterium]|jgi:hypothetical protein